MNNPYQTPGSDVQVREVASKTGWKVFFWMLLGLQVLTVVLTVMGFSDSMTDLAIEITIYTIILVGIFGYAFNKRVFKPIFWKFFIPVVIVYDIYYIFIDDEWAFENTEEMFWVIGTFVVVFLPLIFFQYLALVRYAFGADEIWKCSNAKEM